MDRQLVRCPRSGTSSWGSATPLELQKGAVCVGRLPLLQYNSKGISVRFQSGPLRFNSVSTGSLGIQRVAILDVHRRAASRPLLAGRGGGVVAVSDVRCVPTERYSGANNSGLIPLFKRPGAAPKGPHDD